MNQIEISEQRLKELQAKEFECYQLRKRFLHLDKPQQELVVKLQKYEKALETIAWDYAPSNPSAMRMAEAAKQALYK